MGFSICEPVQFKYVLEIHQILNCCDSAFATQPAKSPLQKVRGLREPEEAAWGMHQNKHLLFFSHCPEFHIEYPQNQEHLIGRHIHEKFALNHQADFTKQPSSRGGDTAQLSKARLSFLCQLFLPRSPMIDSSSCSGQLQPALHLGFQRIAQGSLLSFPFTCTAEEQYSL